MVSIESSAKRVLTAILVALTVVTVGCGGSGNNVSQSSSAVGTTVQVNIGDAPNDWIMAFGVTVNSITLMNSAGGSVNVLPSPTQIELMQLMGTVQPISLGKVPQGSYTAATMTFSSVQMGYMDPLSHQFAQKAMSGPFTSTVNFTPAMMVGAMPIALNFDMNMGSSVSIDANGNVAFTPVLVAMMNSVGSSQNPWQGWMQHMVGAVASASGSQFTMNMMMGLRSATLNTNTSTRFVGLGGMGSMSAGMIISVDALPQADGSLLAQRVESMWDSGMMGGGIVQNIIGNPPTQLAIVANTGVGGGMTMGAIAGTITVNVSSTTPYSFDADDVDLANLPFTPVFDDSTIAKGQKVDVVSGGSMMGGGMMGGGSPVGTINASQVRLEQQALRGAVSNYVATGSQGTFTLSLPADSAFRTLTGVSSITVYQQNGTQLHNLPSITNGAQVGVRGLLFSDAGNYKIVSSWIVAE